MRVDLPAADGIPRVIIPTPDGMKLGCGPRLLDLENCIMAEFVRGGEKDVKWINAELDIIRERSKLLDLSGFVREQRANAGTAPTLILHEDDAGLYAEPEPIPAACGK